VKVATILTRNGQKQGTTAGPAVSNKREEKHRTPEEKMEGTNARRGLRKRHYA
jgi:hypothetical protein